MRPAHLSDAAWSFLDSEVQSVMQLELVLLLQRDSRVPWSAASAARELRTTEPWVAAQLADLAATGVVGTTDEGRSAYRFRADGPRAGAIAEIARRYPQWRASIVRAILDPASSKG